MDSKQKLLELLGGTNFKLTDSNMSVKEFKDMVRYNQKQYAILEAMGDRYRERIWDLMCLVLAEKLQPIMISRFGNTSDRSLYSILKETFNTPGIKSEWEMCKQTALDALGYDGLDAKQLQVINCIIDELPETIIDLLIKIVARIRVIPMQEYAGISQILIQMMREGDYADNTGYN
ncbi:MAG: hypothetical protein PVJ08_08455 [Dehalococcoidia bacterium]